MEDLVASEITTIGIRAVDPRIGGEGPILNHDGSVNKKATFDLALAMLADIKSSMRSLEHNFKVAKTELRELAERQAEIQVLNQNLGSEIKELCSSAELVKPGLGESKAAPTTKQNLDHKDIEKKEDHVFDEMPDANEDVFDGIGTTIAKKNEAKLHSYVADAPTESFSSKGSSTNLAHEVFDEMLEPLELEFANLDEISTEPSLVDIGEIDSKFDPGGNRGGQLSEPAHQFEELKCLNFRNGDVILVLEHMMEMCYVDEKLDLTLAKFVGYLDLANTHTMLGHFESSIYSYTTTFKVNSEMLGDEGATSIFSGGYCDVRWDNEAVYNIFLRSSNIASLRYTNLNCLIFQIIPSLIATQLVDGANLCITYSKSFHNVICCLTAIGIKLKHNDYILQNCVDNIEARLGLDISYVGVAIANIYKYACGKYLGIGIVIDWKEDANKSKLEGGMPSSTTLKDCKILDGIVRKQVAESRPYVAICAAPAVAIGSCGLLKELKATCYPTFMELFSSSTSAVESRLQNGKVVASRGHRTTMEYVISQVELSYGKEKVDEVSGHMVLRSNDGSEYSFAELHPIKWTCDGSPEILVPNSNGSEEMEVVIIIDVLQRAKAQGVIRFVWMIIWLHWSASGGALQKNLNN